MGLFTEPSMSGTLPTLLNPIGSVEDFVFCEVFCFFFFGLVFGLLFFFFF